jgi:hypothetical protein
VPVLVLSAWLLLYAGRPFTLGFYSDDWDIYSEQIQGTAPFSIARFGHFIGIGTTYTSRPVAGVIGFLISSVAGRSPFAYQVCCALFALLAALSLRGWLRSLLPEVSREHPLAADLAAVAWLAAPWSVAATAWPTCSLAALPAQIFFTESARLMAAREGREAKRLLISAALLLASYLSYETFYFQGILVAVFYWFRDGAGSGGLRHRLLLTVCAVQAVSVALNRVIAHFGFGVYKTFALGWQKYFYEAMRDLPGDLFNSTKPLGTVWTVLFGIVVVAAIASAVASSLNSGGRRWARIFSGITLSLGIVPVSCIIYILSGHEITFDGLSPQALTFGSWIGVIALAAISSAIVLLLNSEGRRLAGGFGVITLSLVSIPVFSMIYALAGYKISFSGLTSRTLNGITWAVAVLLYGLLSVILLSKRRAIAIPGVIAALLLVVVSGLTQELQVSEFAAVWQAEKAILARAPVKKIESLPKDSPTNILFVGSSYHGNMAIFGAVWDLTGAVFSLPELREWQRPGQRSVHIHPAATYNWSWDGSALTQELPGYWSQRFAGKAFYLWSYDEGRLIQAQAGFHWDGQNPALNRLPSSGGATPPAATFLKIDTKTQGNWNGVYGADGFMVPFDPHSKPTYAEVKLADANSLVWAPSTQNVRAPEPQVTMGAWWTPLVRGWWTQDRKISCWWSASGFTIDVNLIDGQIHQIAIYLVDWDSGGVAAERVDALDTDSGAVLDTRTISSFSKGLYLVWNLRGHVALRVTPTAAANAVASVLFFQ